MPRCRCLLGFLLLWTVTADAQAPQVDSSTLTEQEVVVRALRRAPLREALEGDVAIEQGRGKAASAYTNPQVSYMREQTFGALGSGEDYLSLTQTFDLGNRRGLQGKAGQTRALAARRAGQGTLLSIAANARTLFYEGLYRRGRVSALEEWVLRSEQALAIVMRREQRGDAATYDRRRLERERAVAIGRRETERAALDRTHASLTALLGADAARAALAGTLLPDSDPAALPLLREASTTRPDLLELELRIKAAELERTAASRAWAPDLRLEAGWKGVDIAQQGRTDGFLLGASLSLPLWDRSTGVARVAQGEAQAARGRRALLALELEGELGGIRAEAVRLRRAAQEFRAETSKASGDLLRIASAGYEGGELGLLELLDAYRGAADDALTALDMEHAARRARIELDRITGTELP